jgi:hypothetical protein
MIQGIIVENGNYALHKNAESKKKTVLVQNAENSFLPTFIVVYIKQNKTKNTNDDIITSFAYSSQLC